MEKRGDQQSHQAMKYYEKKTRSKSNGTQSDNERRVHLTRTKIFETQKAKKNQVLDDLGSARF